MSEKPRTSEPPGPQQPDPLEMLIDRVAEAVVEKLEERRKIDMIAQAVLQRIRLRARNREQGEQERTEEGKL